MSFCEEIVLLFIFHLFELFSFNKFVNWLYVDSYTITHIHKIYPMQVFRSLDKYIIILKY